MHAGYDEDELPLLSVKLRRSKFRSSEQKAQQQQQQHSRGGRGAAALERVGGISPQSTIFQSAASRSNEPDTKESSNTESEYVNKTGGVRTKNNTGRSHHHHISSSDDRKHRSDDAAAASATAARATSSAAYEGGTRSSFRRRDPPYTHFQNGGNRRSLQQQQQPPKRKSLLQMRDQVETSRESDPPPHICARIHLLSTSQRYMQTAHMSSHRTTYWNPPKNTKALSKMEGYGFHSEYLEARGEYGILPRRLRQSLMEAEKAMYHAKPIGLGVYENSIDVVLQDLSVYTYQFSEAHPQEKGILPGELQAVFLADDQIKKKEQGVAATVALVHEKILVASLLGGRSAVAVWNANRENLNLRKGAASFLPQGLSRNISIGDGLSANDDGVKTSSTKSGGRGGGSNGGVSYPREQAHVIRSNAVESLFLFGFYHKICVLSLNPREMPTPEKKKGDCSFAIEAMHLFDSNQRLVWLDFENPNTAVAAAASEAKKRHEDDGGRIGAATNILLVYEEASSLKPNIQRIIVRRGVYNRRIMPTASGRDRKNMNSNSNNNRDSPTGASIVLGNEKDPSQCCVWELPIPLEVGGGGGGRPTVTAVGYAKKTDRLAIGLDTGDLILVDIARHTNHTAAAGGGGGGGRRRRREGKKNNNDDGSIHELCRVTTGHSHHVIQIKWHPLCTWFIAMFSSGQMRAYDWALQPLYIYQDAGLSKISIDIAVDSSLPVLAEWKLSSSSSRLRNGGGQQGSSGYSAATGTTAPNNIFSPMGGGGGGGGGNAMGDHVRQQSLMAHRYEDWELVVVHAAGPIYVVRFVAAIRTSAKIADPLCITQQRLSFGQIKQAIRGIEFLRDNSTIVACLTLIVSRLLKADPIPDGSHTISGSFQRLVQIFTTYWPRFSSTNAEYHSQITVLFIEIIDQACTLKRYTEAYTLATAMRTRQPFLKILHWLHLDNNAPAFLKPLIIDQISSGVTEYGIPKRRDEDDTKQEMDDQDRQYVSQPPIEGQLLKNLEKAMEMQGDGRLKEAIEMYTKMGEIDSALSLWKTAKFLELHGIGNIPTVSMDRNNTARRTENESSAPMRRRFGNISGNIRSPTSGLVAKGGEEEEVERPLTAMSAATGVTGVLDRADYVFRRESSDMARNKR